MRIFTLQTELANTPWQRAFVAIGASQSELARTMGCHRSKISRALKSKQGLINGTDQKRLIAAARKLGKKLPASALVPSD